MNESSANLINVCFITGATGFLGSSFTIELLTKGYHVCLLVRGEDDDTVQQRIHTMFGDKWENSITVIRGSVTDVKRLHENDSLFPKNIHIKNIKKIFHLAAGLSFRSKDKSELFDSNIEGTKQIVWLAERLDVPLLYVSTAYVLGKQNDILSNDSLRYTPKFNNPYEESKFYAEYHVREHMKHNGLKAVIVRPGIIVSDTYTRITSRSSFGLYAIVEATYFLYKNIFAFTYTHPSVAKMLGIRISSDNTIILKYLPMPVSNTHIHFVPLEIVINTMLEMNKNTKIYLGNTYTITPPNPISMKDITKITLTASNIQMPIIIFPKVVVLFFFRIIKYISYVFPFLVILSKRFHSYEYYLVNTYKFDIKNSMELYKKIDTSTFDNQYNYFLKGAKSFIQYLDQTKK